MNANYDEIDDLINEIDQTPTNLKPGAKPS